MLGSRIPWGHRNKAILTMLPRESDSAGLWGGLGTGIFTPAEKGCVRRLRENNKQEKKTEPQELSLTALHNQL